ncbi:MAG: ThuA domain-containing protein [Fibrobacteria bacterium]
MAFGMAFLGLPQAQTASLAEQRTETIGGKQYILTSHLSKKPENKTPSTARGVLVGIFTYGFDHTQGKVILDSTISRIGKAEGWTVDRITTGNDVTTAKLANYQVFFGDYISGWTNPTFPTAGRTALQDFVETAGKGLFVMHSSGDATNTSWTWFRNSVHPCHYNGEASRNDASTGKVGVFKGYQTNPSGVGHPILEGIEWGGKDSTTWQKNELHTFDKNILDASITPVGFRGLLSLNATTCGTPNTCGIGYNYANGAGGNWPVSWTFPLKKGNIGYFMEGHDLTTQTSMTLAVWDRYFKQFMYYMAGYDTSSVTTSVGNPSRNDASASYGIDASGITFHPGSQPGVLVSKAGRPIVTLFDLSGKMIREEKGRVSPVDYDFSADVAGKHGVYVLRVAVSGKVRSQKFVF